MSSGQNWKAEFLVANRLPEQYLTVAAKYFDPLAALVALRQHALAQTEQGKTLIVGVNGSQGSGKSTLCDYLVTALAEDHGLNSIALSLDDFYLTHEQRQHLAASVHPLFATRGVPGTHDVALLQSTLNALSSSSNTQVDVPRFDKARDDRADVSNWTRSTTPIDVVLVEGWCLGAEGDEVDSLSLPLNTLERDEDPGGEWRQYSDTCLRQEYQPVWDEIDLWVMLCAPGFEQVLAWRTEQEQKLRDSVQGQGDGLMDDAALKRFVAHYERHTRQCLRQLPTKVDVLFSLNDFRDIVFVRGLDDVLE